MNTVAAISITLGLLIIATRGPLIFAPERTLRVYMSLLETSARGRAMACLLALAGLAALGGTAGADGMLSGVIAFIAWGLLAVSGLLLLLPTAGQRLMRSILDAFDTAALRILGVLSVGIGMLFVYFGAAAS